MPAKERSTLFPILLIVAVLVIAGVGAGLLYYLTHPSSSSSRVTIQVGDNATVNYIGFIGSGAQYGKVFDTSFYSVAKNNVTYPKSLEFTMRPSAANYTPLPVHVGATSPSSGYSQYGLSFITVVTGFWQGILGMPGNQTTSIVIPPNLGYGPQSPDCFQNASLTSTLPVLRTLSTSQFASAYPGVSAAQGTEFRDPTYGWPVYVLSANSTVVVVQNQPTVGWSSTPSTVGWPVAVTALNSTTITLTNELTPADAGLVLGHSTASVCSQTQYIVSAVNTASGTYTRNYNSEHVGQTLIFVVTIVDIFPA